MAHNNVSNTQFLAAQLFIFTVVWFVSQSESAENALKWVTMVARYTVYLLTARGVLEAYTLICRSFITKRLSLPKLFAENKLSWMTYTTALIFSATSKETLVGENLVMFVGAYIICQYLQTEQKPQPTINYGTGMACSFFEGYLKHVIPSDGKQDGFVEKIRKWEDSENKTLMGESRGSQVRPKSIKCDLERPTPSNSGLAGILMACLYFEDSVRVDLENDFVKRMEDWEDREGVVFPVKRLLLVITKSLYCPRDFSEKNEPNRHDLPQIKACVEKSLEKVEKDVAGVKKRSYSNTTYVISWPDRSQPPVYIAAECATPLHTLHGVLDNQRLYAELVKANKDELVSDFVNQLQTILDRSEACRNKCEMVFFDDTEGSAEYLPEVLLKKIEELEPNYREVIARHEAENQESGMLLDEIVPEVPPRVLIPNI